MAKVEWDYFEEFCGKSVGGEIALSISRRPARKLLQLRNCRINNLFAAMPKGHITH